MALPGQTPERKEKPALAGEKVPIVERGMPKEVSPEVKDWLTRLETGEEIQLPQPVTDDSGQVIVDSPFPQQVTISLPLTDDEVEFGLAQKVTESIRWLAEWCLRLIKITHGKIFYRTKNEPATV